MTRAVLLGLWLSAAVGAAHFGCAQPAKAGPLDVTYYYLPG